MQPAVPACVGDPMQYHRVQAGITGENLHPAARGGIAPHDGVDIFLQASEHLGRVMVPGRAARASASAATRLVSPSIMLCWRDARSPARSFAGETDQGV
jgi:hypothetical protein